MSKLKTNKSLLKRFKITARGKLKHQVPGAAHLMSKKNSRLKSRKSRMRVLESVVAKTVIRGIPGMSLKKTEV